MQGMQSRISERSMTTQAREGANSVRISNDLESFSYDQMTFSLLYFDEQRQESDGGRGVYFIY